MTHNESMQICMTDGWGILERESTGGICGLWDSTEILWVIMDWG